MSYLFKLSSRLIVERHLPTIASPFQVKWEVPYCIWIAQSARIAKTIGHYRSIKSRSNDCRSNKCRSNDCRSIECRNNDIIPSNHAALQADGVTPLQIAG
jgi:hypothetical protein